MTPATDIFTITCELCRAPTNSKEVCHRYVFNFTQPRSLIMCAGCGDLHDTFVIAMHQARFVIIGLAPTTETTWR